MWPKIDVLLERADKLRTREAWEGCNSWPYCTVSLHYTTLFGRQNALVVLGAIVPVLPLTVNCWRAIVALVTFWLLDRNVQSLETTSVAGLAITTSCCVLIGSVAIQHEFIPFVIFVHIEVNDLLQEVNDARVVALNFCCYAAVPRAACERY